MPRLARAELGSRQITTADSPSRVRPSLNDRLEGRSLLVPDGQGGWEPVRVNTLRRNVKGPHERQLFVVGDYNDQDARARIAPALAREVPDRKHRETVPMDVDRFATLSGSYEAAEAALYSVYPDQTLVYYNVAPRGANNGGDNHKDVTWKGEQRQGLIFGITDTAVPVIGVNSGYNFSLLKDRLVGAWHVDFSHDPQLAHDLNSTQFRSLNVYPYALGILRGREGRKFFGEPVDIDHEIPSPPLATFDPETGELTANLLYIDGREVPRGYHNQVLLLRQEELPPGIVDAPVLLGTIGDVTHAFINTFAPGHEQVKTGDFFLTEGSSGDRRRHWLEANRLYAPAADAFGLDGVTDNTTITFKAASW